VVVAEQNSEVRTTMGKIASVTVVCDNMTFKYTCWTYDIRAAHQHIVAVGVRATMTEVDIIDLNNMTLLESYVRHVGTYEEICVSNITSIMIVNEVE